MNQIPEYASSSSASLNDESEATWFLQQRRLDIRYEAYKESLDIPVNIFFSRGLDRTPFTLVPCITSTIRATQTLADVLKIIWDSPASLKVLYDEYKLEVLDDAFDIVVSVTDDNGTSESVYRDLPTYPRNEIDQSEFYVKTSIWVFEWDESGKMASKKHFDAGHGPSINVVMRDPDVGKYLSRMSNPSRQVIDESDQVKEATRVKAERRLSLRQRFEEGT